MAGIGIFGGTFDPIHLGHLRSAWEVTQFLSLDTLYFVPNAQTVHRHQPNTAFADRLAMVELAIAHVPQWQASSCEGDRACLSYSFDTVTYFRQQYGNEQAIWLLLGSDAYRHFHRWHRWQELLGLCNLAVMTRAGEQVVGGCVETQDCLQRGDLTANAGSVVPVDVTALDISSSQIRNELTSGREARFLVAAEVLDYIQSHKLYPLA